MYRHQPPPQAGGYRIPNAHQYARRNQQPQQSQQDYDGATYAQAEVVAPQPDGKRAVVAMTIQVLVEVDNTNDYNDMVEQAKEDLYRRVVEARTFLPLQMRSERIYQDKTVMELRNTVVTHPSAQWQRLGL